jgi:hypothetical protein
LVEGYNGKTTSKMTLIRQGKTTEKWLRPFGDRSVELHFGFCFQQNAYGGWGRGLRDTGRGLQESPESRVIADIARDRDSKTSPRMNSDDTDQESLRWSGMRSRNLFVFLIEAWGEGGVASPIQVLHSRQRRPLFQDDKVEARRFHAARTYSIAVAAVIARDRKSKTAVALSLPLLPTDFRSRVKKALTGPF